MSDPNFDHSEGDWDEFSSEPYWSESQWRNYLKGSDRDTVRFLSIYNSVKDKPNHLDEVASLMGWDAEDISMTDEFSFMENPQDSDDEPSNALNDDDEGDENEGAPYTLHRHPVFVVTRSLYRYLHQSWEHFMVHSEYAISPKLSWDYANSLHQAEMNVLLSIQALDLGDFGLSICHLKNSLSALNQTLHLLNQLTHPNEALVNGFRTEARIRLFDLRELWIRVMGDCRHECQRRPGDQD
ncbi:hypothetical protein SH580_20035 [Coraliomargarita algicola]|uniref:Uncharacterized protein n=1 Tax=Coraliomargarita algicola TaxID=3092156 RepID=A0ABZ0RJK1_9BACT|nr:hypothetical protein [Coraliomargarita sp. J2-16]WPJ95712.1 hypothetical protein SH580_20035 [Coraliomargarita sp. J2-16]